MPSLIAATTSLALLILCLYGLRRRRSRRAQHRADLNEEESIELYELEVQGSTLHWVGLKRCWQAALTGANLLAAVLATLLLAWNSAPIVTAHISEVRSAARINVGETPPPAPSPANQTAPTIPVATSTHKPDPRPRPAGRAVSPVSSTVAVDPASSARTQQAVSVASAPRGDTHPTSTPAGSPVMGRATAPRVEPSSYALR